MTSFTKRCQPATAAEMKVKSWTSWIVLAVMVIVGVGMGFRLTHQQERIKESEARFNLAVDGSGAGLWYWDITTPGHINDYDHVWYSDRFLELVNVQREDWPDNAATVLGRIHPDDVQMVRDAVDEHVSGRAPVYEATHRMSIGGDGYRWFRARGQCNHDRTHMAGSIIDIHEAFEQRRRAETIVMSAGIAMIMCDDKQRVTIYNTAAEKLLGWTAEEVIGKKIHVFVPNDLRGDHIEKLLTATERVQSQEGKDIVISRRRMPTIAKHKDGTKIPVFVSLRSIRYGNMIEFVAVIQTQKKDDPAPTDTPEVRPFRLPQRQLKR